MQRWSQCRPAAAARRRASTRSLFAQIDAIDESQRAEARRRLEQEWQQQMQALARNWRRTLAVRHSRA